MTAADNPSPGPVAVVLGIAQDAGFPHIGCQAACCAEAWKRPPARVSCLGLADPAAGVFHLIDATPDLPSQLHEMQRRFPDLRLGGVWLTHAHIGHYAGLMYLGREGLAGRGLPLYASSDMARFLQSSGPWDRVLSGGHAELVSLHSGEEITTGSLRLEPFSVPHRREYSDTLGFRISGPTASALFVPDTDAFSRWQPTLNERLADVDRTWLDGTFFSPNELPGRELSQVPHPPIPDTVATVDPSLRSRVHFIHLNHTNPALDPESDASAWVAAQGAHVAREGDVFEL